LIWCRDRDASELLIEEVKEMHYVHAQTTRPVVVKQSISGMRTAWVVCLADTSTMALPFPCSLGAAY